jgi:hypothetical protein
MNAFLPAHLGVLLVFIYLVVASLMVAAVLTRMPSGVGTRLIGWALVVLCFAGTGWLTAAEPAGFRMLALILALWFPLKGLAGMESGTRLSFGRWLAFCLFWPGMDPVPFAHRPAGPLPAGREIQTGLLHMGAGALLFTLARYIRAAGCPWLATAVVLPALSLLVHFGVFDLLTAAWRRQGVDLRPPFREPLKSSSLAEFWSQRWNCAFSEMGVILVYRPLVGVSGRNMARLVVFLVSGLLHEAAISVLVRAGYGGPFLYFLLHALLVHIERNTGRALPPIPCVLLPLPLLFHAPFIAGVIWPLLG